MKRLPVVDLSSQVCRHWFCSWKGALRSAEGKLFHIPEFGHYQDFFLLRLVEGYSSIFQSRPKKKERKSLLFLKC